MDPVLLNLRFFAPREDPGSSADRGAGLWPAESPRHVGCSERLRLAALWYICKTHGVYLQHRAPGQNICPVDGQNWTGWPYHQVIYARRHSESTSGGRATAQTLDEAGWLEVTATDFEDRIWCDPAGRLAFIRRTQGALRRLGVAGLAGLEDRGQILLQVDPPAPVEVDFSLHRATLNVLVNEAPGGELRVLAPQAQHITVNGTRIDFRRDGDYCLIPLPAQ